MALESRRLLASPYEVENSNDSGSGSLRAIVLAAANAGAPVTITFDPAVFSTPQTIRLTTGELLFSSGNITIDGPGADLLTVEETIQDRLGQVVTGASATITGLTLTGGSKASYGGGFYVENKASLTLTDCTISGNTGSDGGGIFSDGTLLMTGCTISDDSADYGGGLCNYGKATLIGCTLSGDSGFKGGGVENYKYGHVYLTDCTIAENSATYGGGLANYGVSDLTACTVSGNSASSTDITLQHGAGGGVYNYARYYGGQVNLFDTIVAQNYGGSGFPSDIGGDGIWTVVGSNDLIGIGGSGGIHNGTYGDIVLTDPTKLGLGSLGDYGGPTATIPLLPGSAAINKGTSESGVTTDQRGFALDSPIDMGAYQDVAVPLVVGSAGDGGAGVASGSMDLRGAVDLAELGSAAATITFDPTAFATEQAIVLTEGRLAITGTITIEGPSAGLSVSGGGAVGVFEVEPGASATISGLTLTGGSAATGGGLYNLGTATLEDCSIVQNSATGNGGGLANLGVLDLIECTVGDDVAGGSGGGLFDAGTALMVACTISGNTAGAGGGIDQTGTAPAGAMLADTIVAGNIGVFGSASDIAGSGASGVVGTFDLIGEGGSGGIGGGTGDVVLSGGAGPGLSPLGNFGGGTLTFAVLPGSPAIDAGSTAMLPSGTSSDQRGQPRVAGAAADIGAFESQGFTIATVAGSSPQEAMPGAAFAMPLAVAVAADLVGDPVAGGVVTFALTPVDGAGATLATSTATIGAGETAQVTATANTVYGSYVATADADGVGDGPARFDLTNLVPVTFSGLSSPTIVFGTASSTFSGTIADGQEIPAGQSVSVTFQGDTQPVTIQADGSFATTFQDTGGLGVVGSPYGVSYAYAGDSTYGAASATGWLTVAKATPTIVVTAPGGAYDDAAFVATATVAGIGGQASTTLESVGLSLSYYAGNTATGQALGVAPSTAGTYTVQATFVGSADYGRATESATFAIVRATPIVTWDASAGIVYGTALSSTQLDASASVAGTITYTPPAGTVLTAGTQTLSATFAPTDSNDYTAATATVPLVVYQATPTLTWASPAAITYGTALGSSQLDASANVAGTFAYTPAAGTILDAGANTLSVTFTPQDATDYATATKTTTLVVNQATPTIAWATPSVIAYGTSLTSMQLDAVGSVAGTIAYSPAAGSVLSVGTQTLSATFTPTDSNDYITATATVPLAVHQATPTIAWSTPSAIVYGTALGSSQLDANGSVAGTITYSPAAGAVLGAGTQTLSAIFTPTDSNDYITATATVPLVVDQATPTMTWATPSAIVYGTALGSSQLNAIGSVAGTITYSPAIEAVLGAGTQTLSATFTPTDSNDYTTATATVPLVVDQAATTIDWPTPSAIVYGTALGSSQLVAIGSVAGTITYTPAAGTVLTAGTQTLQASFTPTDSTDYTIATASVSLVVDQATPTIAWAAPSAIVYGTALNSAQLDAIGSVAGTITYSPAVGAVLTAGTQTLSATFTPTDTTDYTTATASIPLVVDQATPTIAWATPSAIVYGTALSSAQLDATGRVAGTISYSPAVGAVLGAGTQTLQATFTPTDSTDYQSVTASVPLEVDQATPTVTWAAPLAIVYGTALSTVQLDAIGSVAGTITYSPAAGAVLTAGTQTLQATFTPTDSTDDTAATATTTIVVGPATPTIIVVAGGVYDGQPIAATATVAGIDSEPSATLEGNAPVLTYYDGATATSTALDGPPTGVGSYTVVAVFPGSDDYASATIQAGFAITQATPAIDWPTPSAITSGTALGSTQLDAIASVAGSFAYTPAVGAVLAAGAQSLSVTFTPTDSNDYTGATATTTLFVLLSTSVTWATPSPIVYGTALSSSQLDAIGSVAGTITYLPAAGKVLSAGIQTLTATLTPADPAEYAPSTAQVTIVVQATPTITWSEPSAIVYGTALSSAQLDAIGSVAGTIAYSPPTGTVLGAGTQTLSATFTPDDTTNFTAATTTTILIVAKATPAIVWVPPVSIVYGTPMGPSQRDATANVPGTFAYSVAAGTVLGVGTYRITSTFTPLGTADETSTSASSTIAVVPAVPTVRVQAVGGTFDGSPIVASVTVTGVAGLAGPTLEGVAPVLTYSEGGTTIAGPPSASGTYTVTATFPGSADYAGATAATVTFAIEPAASAVSISASGGSSVFGQPVTLTAVVVAPGTPTGTITFLDGGTAIGSAPLDASGRAVLTVDDLSPGAHAITSAYSGDPDRDGSQSVAASLTVGPDATQVVLVPHPVFRRKKLVGLSLTAEVLPIAPGGGLPTGTVTFAIQIHKKKQRTLASTGLTSGQATLSLKPQKILNKPITISYTGGPGYQPSQLAGTRLSSRSLAVLARTAARLLQAGPIRRHLSLK